MVDWLSFTLDLLAAGRSFGEDLRFACLTVWGGT